MSRPTRRSARRSSTASATGWATRRAVGLPELREAIAAWASAASGDARSGHGDHPDAREQGGDLHVRARRGRRGRGADTVAYTDPGYPVYERGALFAHARPLALPLREEHGFLPDLDAIDDETWPRLAVFWINYPNNPTAATAPLSFYERLAALAREHGFVVASDEAYTELWFDEPPGLGAAARRPDECRRLQHALQAELDDGLSQRLRRRRP